MMELLRGYLDAKLKVIEAGYENDIAWAEGLEHVEPDAQYLMCEAAWVIINSDFRYAVARRLWPIVELAAILRREGHERIVAEAQDPPKLTRLPWIGKITCWHLAKVLGADVIKPDVHLTRAAKWAGFETAVGLCKAIRDLGGDRLTVIDSVLWRYGEQQEVRKWPSWEQLWCMDPV